MIDIYFLCGLMRVPLPFLWKVRAASITCFAGMTSAVFISFTKDNQDFIMSSLVSFDGTCSKLFLLPVLW